MQRTINYYNQNTKEYVDGTVWIDFSEIQNQFCDFLPHNAYVLDFGCGSGRDTKFFLKQGFQVDAIDGSIELCKLASEYTGVIVKHMLFQELNIKDKYDGIWACASILHLKKAELPGVLRQMSEAIKKDGIIYISFKYGDFEGQREGRYFTEFTEKSAKELLKTVPELKKEKQWITGDVRIGRGNERWINMIFRK